MKSMYKIIAMVFLSLAVSPMANAQAKGYLGGFLGMSIPDYDDTSARPMFGLLGGARLDGEWGLGGFYLSSSQEEDVNGTKFDFNYQIYGFDGTFHLEGVADGAYVGARLGFAKLEVGSVSVSPMAWGLHFGYDHFFTENFSAGVEAGFMSVEGDSDTVGTTTVTTDGFTLLNFAATGKFWF